MQYQGMAAQLLAFTVGGLERNSMRKRQKARPKDSKVKFKALGLSNYQLGNVRDSQVKQERVIRGKSFISFFSCI
jgi:hypothetical protein